MGADRKGPLAAFVVIAIIAAILLVTSVRSQAAPALLAAAPSDDLLVVGQRSAASHARSSVGDDGGQQLRDGVVLDRRATPARSGAPTPSASTTAAAPGSEAPVVDGTPAGHRTRPHLGGRHARHHPHAGRARSGRSHAPAPHHDRGHHHGPLQQARGLAPR